MIFKLINFFRGYVHIKIYGKFIERFINICTFHNIFLWDIVKNDNQSMTLCLSRKAYREVDLIAEKSKVTVEVLKKRGLPYILGKYRKRKVFAVGALLFVLVTSYLLSLVWSVEVIGNENIPTEELLDQVKESGIVIGAYKRKINPNDVITDLMLGRDDLSWVGVYIKGTKVTVHVTERDLPPPMEDDSMPGDVIAVKDGVIREVIVKAGVAAVKKGDSVFKGDVLIKGEVPLKFSDTKMKVHAKGEVYATTWYGIKKEITGTKIVKEFTGREYKKVRIEVLGRGINLPKPVAMTFTEYELEVQQKQASIKEKIMFPVISAVFVYKEVRSKEIEMDEKEALDHCVALIEEQAKDVIPDKVEILAKYLRYVYDEYGKKYAEMIFECKEDIGF